MSNASVLEGLALVDRVRDACVAGATVRLLVGTASGSGEIGVVRGEIVHARWGAYTGVEALFELLAASRAGGELRTEPTPPAAHSVSGSWRTHLLGALERLERSEQAGEAAAESQGSLRVGRDGDLTAGAGSEREAALVGVLGRIGAEVGSALALGRLRWLEAEVGGTVRVVVPTDSGWAAVRVAPGSDPARALERLLSETGR